MNSVSESTKSANLEVNLEPKRQLYIFIVVVLTNVHAVELTILMRNTKNLTMQPVGLGYIRTSTDHVKNLPRMLCMTMEHTHIVLAFGQAYVNQMCGIKM